MKELRDLKYLTMYDIQPISDPFARRPRRLVWVSWLEGDLRRQGYEASKVDSRKPRKHIDLGIVDWKDRLCHAEPFDPRSTVYFWKIFQETWAILAKS